jgi:hypothetical protein
MLRRFDPQQSGVAERNLAGANPSHLAEIPRA